MTIDLFLKFIDMLIYLAKLRAENKIDIFEKIIQPMFNEFEQVAGKYLAFFQYAQDSLRTSKIEKELLTSMRDQRRDYQLARAALTSLMLEVVKSTNDEDILKLCRTIEMFFFPLSGERSAGNALRHLLKEAAVQIYVPKENIGGRGVAPRSARLIRHAGEAIQRMEDDWAEATRLYSKLRIKYLLPT